MDADSSNRNGVQRPRLRHLKSRSRPIAGACSVRRRLRLRCRHLHSRPPKRFARGVGPGRRPERISARSRWKHRVRKSAGPCVLNSVARRPPSKPRPFHVRLRPCRTCASCSARLRHRQLRRRLRPRSSDQRNRSASAPYGTSSEPSAAGTSHEPQARYDAARLRLRRYSMTGGVIDNRTMPTITSEKFCRTIGRLPK